MGEILIGVISNKIRIAVIDELDCQIATINN